MFKASDNNQKSVLEKFFKQPLDIRSKVKSFLDACSVLNIDSKSVFTSSDTKDEVAFKKLKVIIKALNEGWYPDWENSNEHKYWDWWRMKGGFSYYDTDYHTTTATVPSALYVGTDAEAQYLGKYFLDLSKDYITEEL